MHGLRVRVHEAPAETSRRAERPLENLQTALQQFRVEVLVSGDLDSHKLVFVAAFNGVSDGFLSPLPGAGFHLMHPDFVAYVGVEISLALQTLTNVALPFFEQVRVDRALLVNWYQFLEFGAGKLRATDGNFYARPLCCFEENRDGVLCRVVVASPDCDSRANMPPFRQEFPDALDPALEPGRGDVLTGFHLEPRQDVRVFVCRIIL